MNNEMHTFFIIIGKVSTLVNELHRQGIETHELDASIVSKDMTENFIDRIFTNTKIYLMQ